MAESPIEFGFQAFYSRGLDGERLSNLRLWILGGKVTDIQPKSKKLLD